MQLNIRLLSLETEPKLIEQYHPYLQFSVEPSSQYLYSRQFIKSVPDSLEDFVFPIKSSSTRFNVEMYICINSNYWRIGLIQFPISLILQEFLHIHKIEFSNECENFPKTSVELLMIICKINHLPFEQPVPRDLMEHYITMKIETLETIDFSIEIDDQIFKGNSFSMTFPTSFIDAKISLLRNSKLIGLIHIPMSMIIPRKEHEVVYIIKPIDSPQKNISIHFKIYIGSEQTNFEEKKRETYQQLVSITKSITGKRMTFKSYHGLYLSAQKNGKIECNRKNIGDWERFEISQVGPMLFSIFSFHHRYLSASPDGKVVCDRTNAKSYEQFFIIPHNDKFHIRSCHGFFLCAENNGKTVCNRKDAREWETFTITSS